MLVIRVRFTFIFDGCIVFQSFAIYIIEFAFEDGGCREIMSYWIFDKSCGNVGVGRYY